MRDVRVPWIRTAGVTGIAAVAIYSTFFFVDWPPATGVVVASLFGISLAVGCAGLRVFLNLHEPTVAADIAAGLGILAGLVVMLMLIVQLAIRNPDVTTGLAPPTQIALEEGLDRVHYGLDVAWDVLIAAATLLFALRAWSHPRLGRWFSATGVAIAGALIATNLATFPLPPAGSGSVDVGPLVGLWYVATSVQVLRSLSWARQVT